MSQELDRVVEMVLQMDEPTQVELWNRLLRKGVPVTRLDPWMAYRVAYVYSWQCDELRRIACQNPETAYRFAKDVDRARRDDTCKAVEGTEWADRYARIGAPRLTPRERENRMLRALWEGGHPKW